MGLEDLIPDVREIQYLGSRLDVAESTLRPCRWVLCVYRPFSRLLMQLYGDIELIEPRRLGPDTKTQPTGGFELLLLVDFRA